MRPLDPIPSGSSATLGWLDRLARQALPPLDELGGPGTILSPIVLVTLLSFCTAVVVGPTLTRMSGGSNMAGWMWLLVLAAPPVTLLKGAVLAGVAWSVLVLADRGVSFRTTFSAMLYGELVLALQGPALAVLARVSGGLPRSPGLLAGPVQWVPHGEPVLTALAGGLSPFHVAWWAFVAVALNRRAELSRGGAAVLASLLWLVLLSPAAVQALTA